MIEFPAGFFDRADEAPDADFYSHDRLVTHLDEDAVAAVSELYRELGLTGQVLDLCSSWISHFDTVPDRLVALGMNANELAANRAATDTIIHDLNVDPVLPFDDDMFDAVTCCMSIDYLTDPVAVFADVARVLRPGGTFVVSFSNRCFPTKAIRAWLAADDQQRCAIVAAYFAAVDEFAPPTVQLRNPESTGDPLYAVWASTQPTGVVIRPATIADQALITAMQYEACFVPPGEPPFDRSILDEPPIRAYHADFGTRPGDVGRVAVGSDGVAMGAAWVRRIDGYGFVDDRTPELGIAVAAGHRGGGIGTALLSAIMAVVPRLSLSVDRRNPAMKWYERVGFDIVRAADEHSVVMLRDRSNG